MAVEHSIEQIDEQGGAGNVLTDYKVHTISLVGKGALGRNITKLKSNEEFIETEEGKAIMSKIDKAKSLDAEEAAAKVENPEEITPEVVETEKSKSVEEQTQEVEPEAVEQAPEETSEVEAVVEQTEEENPSEDVTEVSEESEPVEKAKAEETDDEEEEDKVKVDPEGEEEDAEKTVEPKNEGEEVEKQKMFTMDEYLDASKSSLDALSKMVKEIKAKAPEAESWEIFDLIYDAVYIVDVANWYNDDAMWEKVSEEVYSEVTSRVNKAKALKVSEEGSLDDKLKALEAVDPSLAALFKANSQKALEAEQEREAVIRAKKLEQGAELYKRISSEDCTTDQITDALINLEVSSPEDFKVIAKALNNASVITSAGDLFRDTGMSDTASTLTADEYVEVKSKALAASKEEKGESFNMAALRADVRQTDEYTAMYS